MSFQETMDKSLKKYRTDTKLFLEKGVKTDFLKGVQKNLGLSDEIFESNLRGER